jgi:EpsI family protein
MSTAVRWIPAALLALGAVFTVGVDTQRSLPLRAPLDTTVPTRIAGYVARDLDLSSEVLAVAAPSKFLNRVYEPDHSNTAGTFSLYIAYYDSQVQGKTIHSPKNCLPGSGWEPLTSQPTIVRTASGPEVVNRYLLQGRQQRALVLYWYQGRGRLQANEYRVKLDLLRDAAFRRRSDEALVRIVVPLTDDEESAFALASEVARVVIPTLNQALPL